MRGKDRNRVTEAKLELKLNQKLINGFIWIILFDSCSDETYLECEKKKNDYQCLILHHVLVKKLAPRDCSTGNLLLNVEHSYQHYLDFNTTIRAWYYHTTLLNAHMTLFLKVSRK